MLGLVCLAWLYLRNDAVEDHSEALHNVTAMARLQGSAHPWHRSRPPGSRSVYNGMEATGAGDTSHFSSDHADPSASAKGKNAVAPIL